MAEILSQAQIDALLKGINDGSVDEAQQEKPKEKIKVYDFRSPKKFTKEQLRIMESLHESFGRHLSSYLSGVLRKNCTTEIASIEEFRYFEFNNALADNALIALVDMVPSNHNVNPATFLLDISPNLVFYMIDRLLGGRGETNAIPNREFSEIEVAIMNHETKNFVGYMQQAWKDYMDNSCSLASIETNTRLIQIYSPDDIVVVVTITVSIERLSGNITICIPGVGLEEMMQDFVSKYGRASKHLSSDNKEAVREQLIRSAIDSSSLDMTAILSDTVLNLSDVLSLQVNDIVPLQKKASEDIVVKIDSVPWFAAQVGTVKNNKAIKLTGRADTIS